MKKSLAKKITLSILAGAVLMSSSVVWAAVPSGWNEVIDVGYVRDSSTNADGTVPVGNHEKRFYGAYDSGNNNVTHGKVKITGGSVSGHNIRVYGGHSSSGDATDNEVTITGGTVGTSEHKIAIYGGYSSDCAATGNKVDISGNSSITGYVYGGDSYGNTASGNTVTIRSSSNVTGEVYGGRSGSKNNTGVELEKRKSTNNTVEIYGGTINGSVYGGQSMYEGASATGNTVTISGGTISGDETEKVKVSGGWSSNKGEVSSNTVIISGESEIKDADVYGGWSQAGKTTGNTVTISGVSKVENTNIYGGYSFPYGLEGGGDATGNTVTISSGTFTDTIVQGGGVDGIGNATNNTVIISGGTFTGEIYGGKTVNGGSVDSYKATGNTVNISGNAVLENAELYGGYVINNSCYGGATNANTLNIGVDDDLKSQLAEKGIDVAVGAWNNKKVNSIAGFDVINFNYVNWSNGETVVETETLALSNTKVGKVVIGSGTVENGEWMNLISAGSVAGTFATQQDITIRTGLTTSEIVKGDIELIDNNLKLTITTDISDGVSGGTGSGDGGSGTSSSTNVPTGATSFVDAIDKVGEETVAYKVLDAVYTNYTTDEEQKKAATNMLQLGEAGGQSATAANISRNVSGATVNRMSFGGRGGVRHRGGHGPADFNEKDGSAVWAQYVHGKDKVDGMALADGVTTSYESQFNGVVLGVDFKEVGKYQSGIAFNYGEGDSHTKNIALSRSDYDFWGIGYYGAVKNADSNVIFDINYAKTDSEVKQQFRGGVELEAEPETTTISAGVKVEKLIDKEAMQFVPYAGLRFMSIDTDEYSANYLGKEAFNYSADRQNIWLLPVGVSFRQENVYDSGWVVTPKVDLSYIWAFGDTENEMTVRTPDVAEAARLGYTVMNDGSFLGSIGLEAEKGDWTFGVAYSYQKSSDSRSDRWYVDAKYSF